MKNHTVSHDFSRQFQELSTVMRSLGQVGPLNQHDVSFLINTARTQKIDIVDTLGKDVS